VIVLALWSSIWTYGAGKDKAQPRTEEGFESANCRQICAGYVRVINMCRCEIFAIVREFLMVPVIAERREREVFHDEIDVDRFALWYTQPCACNCSWNGIVRMGRAQSGSLPQWQNLTAVISCVTFKIDTIFSHATGFDPTLSSQVTLPIAKDTAARLQRHRYWLSSIAMVRFPLP